MKNVFLILMLFSGFAMSTLSAQSCKPADCAPCPPGCCIINSCKSDAAASAVKTNDAAFVLVAAQQEVQSTMSRKEMKACMTACKKANVAATKATSPPPACQPASCQSKTALVNTTPVAPKEASLSKG